MRVRARTRQTSGESCQLKTFVPSESFYLFIYIFKEKKLVFSAARLITNSLYCRVFIKGAKKDKLVKLE
jgi:hypothetical protein